MKLNTYKWTLALATMFTLAACDSDVEHNIPEVDAPVLVSTTPTAGASTVKRGDITIEVTYDKNVNFATKDINKIQFTGGTLISADVYGVSKTLTIKVNVPLRETSCSLTIPEGVVTGPNKMPAPAVSLDFSTIAVTKNLVAATSPKAVKLYNYLLQNFESKTLSAMMANVSWNTEMSERVFQWTGSILPSIHSTTDISLHLLQVKIGLITATSLPLRNGPTMVGSYHACGTGMYLRKLR